MRIVAMVLAVCLLFSVYVSADDLNNDIYVYELEEDFISVKGIKDNNLSGKIIVPSDIDNVAVKIINPHTFLNTNVEEIVFMEGLEEISSFAISDCVNLKKVIIPASCKIIGGVSYMPAIEYCDNLETIEIYGEYESLPLFVADCPSLKNIVFYGDVINITNEFKYNFYKCEPRVKRVNPRVFTEALDITIKGKSGSNIEKFAKENGFNFISIESENNLPAVDISKYTESKNYHVEKIIPTEYGTVLYFWPVGAPHGGKNPKLALIKDDGSEVNLSESASRLDFYHSPELENIVLAEDGKNLLFSVSFKERSEGTLADGEKIVLHDAGTYFYKADLETGACIETKFEPLDTISEEIISVWAKTEVENAIELGFVPLSLRDNYKRNITRGEFAKLAMFFLSVQYGYPGVPAVQVWSPVETNDNSFFSREFMNAYCYSRKDRNGNSFADINVGEAYVYNNNREILLDVTPFSDVNENIDLGFIERAYHLGIVNGISETEFKPDGEITRQEAAAMLMRVYKIYAQMEKISGEFKFSDDKDIAEWAQEDVYSINSLGIMQGVGENFFDPLNGYTVEQAIITFWRLYDSAPVSRKNKNIAPLLEYEYELENYFNRAAATSHFHEQSRKEYENFIVVCGYWSRLHTTALDYNLYVFDKNGGVPYVASLTEDMKWEVSSDEKVITCYESVGDTFRLYNKLNGIEKVYSAGMYKTDYSVEQGKVLNFERVK